MIDYYKIFNLTLAKKKGTITDDMVRSAYETKKEQYIKMQKNKNLRSQNIGIASDELTAYLDGEYLQILQDAYYALSSENARKHYDELMENINRHIEEQRIIKSKNSGLEEMIQSTNLDTKELLDKIKKEAKQKYPIPGIDKEQDKDNLEL